MTDCEREVCYSCGKINKNHSIQELYLCLAYFSNNVRTFDRTYNYSLLECIKEIKEENHAIHTEYVLQHLTESVEK